ncbi:hypothetical protein ATCC90586_005493 [Pythium insidiosum]|nr:hypothetical protein ATCC90586_005493 [Pythium insidiosum]
MDYSPRSMNIMFVSLIGDGKFLKSIYCKCDEGSLIVKIYRKFDPNESLSSAEVALRRLSLAFTTENQPNLLPYADYQLSAKFNVAFMVRQYFASNLYDRICSRPFLTPIEKKWIAFQILRALEQCVEDPEGEQFFKHRLREGYGSDRQLNSEILGLDDDDGHVAQRVLEELEQKFPAVTSSSRDKTSLDEDNSNASIDQVKEREREMSLSTTAQKKKIEKLNEQYQALTEKKKQALKTDVPRIEAGKESDVNSGGNIPESKITALYLIRYLGQHTTDEVRLQRLVPFLLELVDDANRTFYEAASGICAANFCDFGDAKDGAIIGLITFLNDRDWELRGAFFEHITGVCAFVGRVTVELYILPCIEQALFDVHEIVITKALECLGALCQLGLFLGIYGIAAAFDEVATTPLSEEPSVRAILCPSLHFRGVADALITGGEDKQIRYWDIRNGKQSFTVCGDGESKSFYDNQSAPSDWWRINSSAGGSGYAGASSDRNDQLVSAATLSSAPSSNSSLTGPSSSTSSTPSKPEMAWSKLSPPIITICQDASYFAAQGGIGAVLAAGGGVESAVTMERRGLVPPSPAHNDCILDLALVDLNGPLLVSSGRDGIIKVWK